MNRPFLRRYQREFGFTISGRPIIVDDIRVRGIGKTELDLETPIKKAADPPRVELVGLCFCHVASLLFWFLSVF